MIELLSGPLIGAAVSNKFPSRNWGHLVLALDPGMLGDRQQALNRVQEMLGR